MKKRSEPGESMASMRAKIIGLGESSIRKSHYPALQRKLQEMERFRALLDQSDDMIFLISMPDGSFVDMNESVCRQLSYSRKELLAMSLSSVTDTSASSGLGRFLEDRERDGEHKSFTGEIELTDSAGNKMPAEISINIAAFIDSEYAIAAARDITARKRLESVAEAVNLMDSIGYVFAGIRHEIANPVNTIGVILQILKTRIDQLPKEKIDKYLDQAKAEMARIEFMLKSLKNFNIFEKIELKFTDLCSFVENFVSTVKGDFNKRGIKIEVLCAQNLSANIDTRAVYQILLNLFANAADALEGVERPEIRINVYKNGKSCMLAIEDNGRGMTGEEQKKLFSPFFTTKPGGTGLGLVIVKRMITAMNGDIRIKSQKGRGTTVTLSLPGVP